MTGFRLSHAQGTIGVLTPVCPILPLGYGTPMSLSLHEPRCEKTGFRGF